MRKLNIFLIIISGIFFFYSCGSTLDSYQNSDTGAEYFPLEIGNTWIYSVDSIVYDLDGTVVDTIHDIVKEKITNTFTDEEGIKTFVLERSSQKDADWVVRDIWSASLNKTQAIRTEDNLRFIKMSFPVNKNKSWDGNAYIDTQNQIVKIAGESIKMYEQWYYRYLDIDIEETIGENTYDNVVVVQQVDKETKLEKRYSEEKYAKNIGLVYKKMIILNTQNNNETVPWAQKAEEGFILEQKLISYSK